MQLPTPMTIFKNPSLCPIHITIILTPIYVQVAQINGRKDFTWENFPLLQAFTFDIIKDQKVTE